jgi:type II secretory pathway pseudopilin PulG
MGIFRADRRPRTADRITQADTFVVCGVAREIATAHGPRPTARRKAQSGFTLAALLVILSVIAVITAFLVPKMWSSIMWRERDAHTIWVMEQYARAISDFQRATGGLPTSLEQLEKQSMPRVLRQTYVNPLSGELDWIMVPAGTATPGLQQQAGQGGAPGRPAGNQPPGTGLTPQGQGPGGAVNPLGQPGGGDPRSYSGPFIGVRPPQTGESFLELFEQKNYENWMYTLNELQLEQTATGAAPPQPGQQPGGPRTN